MVIGLIVSAKAEYDVCRIEIDAEVYDYISCLKKQRQVDHVTRSSLHFFFYSNPDLPVNDTILRLREVEVKGDCFVIRQNEKDQFVDLLDLSPRGPTNPFDVCLHQSMNITQAEKNRYFMTNAHRMEIIE